MSNVLLKKVDPRLYARLKAEAAVEGKSVGEVFNEAVRMWLSGKGPRDEDGERNVEAYLKIKKEITKHPEDYFVIAKGTYLGRFRSLTEAFTVLKDNRTTRALVIRYQPSGEWLGGSLET